LTYKPNLYLIVKNTMSQKTIIIAMVAVLFGLFSGGAIVYQFTNKSNKQILNNTTLSSSSSLQSEQNSEKSSASSISTVTSSSTTESSKEVSKPKIEGTKFLGWIGSMETEVYLNFDKDKVAGKYYNNIDKKWFDLSGSYNANPDKTSGIIQLDEFDNGLVTGKMYFSGIDNPNIFNETDSQKQVFNNNNYGVSAGNYYNKTFTKLIGIYTDVKNNPNDIYIYSNETDYKNVQPITKTLTYFKADGDSIFLNDGANYYFTNESWKLPKDLKQGDKIKVTGKLRNYNMIKYFTIKENPYEGQQTNQGFFQITKAEKV
jgi:hypothetical protein